MAEQAQADLAPDQRASPRRRVLLGAKLVWADGTFSTDCALRNFSDLGARVRLNSAQPVPDDLYLVEPRTGIAYRAQVAWRRMPDIGLAFSEAHALEHAASPHLRILRRIWLDSSPRQGVSRDEG